jgi:chromosome segregation ATPase
MENETNTNTTISPQIKKLMDQLSLTQDQAMQAAGILGFNGKGASATLMEDGTIAPMTQEEAVSKINSYHSKTVSLETTSKEADGKITEFETKLEAITKERDELKKSADEITAKLEEVHKAELEELTESVKAIDTEGKFLATLEGMAYETKKSILTTFLETAPLAKDVKLSRDNAKAGSGAKTEDQIFEEMFGDSQMQVLERLGGDKVEDGGK